MASRLEQKFRFVWRSNDDTWEGTNDRDVAFGVADDYSVLDVVEGKDINTGALIDEVTDVPGDEEEEE